jgi:hypothetical protein
MQQYHRRHNLSSMTVLEFCNNYMVSCKPSNHRFNYLSTSLSSSLFSLRDFVTPRWHWHDPRQHQLKSFWQSLGGFILNPNDGHDSCGSNRYSSTLLLHRRFLDTYRRCSLGIALLYVTMGSIVLLIRSKTTTSTCSISLDTSSV